MIWSKRNYHYKYNKIFAIWIIFEKCTFSFEIHNQRIINLVFKWGNLS